MLNQEARNHMDLSRAKPVGLGDTVAAVTTAAGIKPCGGCKKRQAALNRATPGWVSRLLAWITRLGRQL